MSCATSEVMVKAFDEVVGKGAFKSGFCCHKKSMVTSWATLDATLRGHGQAESSKSSTEVLLLLNPTAEKGLGCLDGLWSHPEKAFTEAVAF